MSRELIGGRYRLRRPVGHGGMGAVWLGTDETLHRDVAVKRMHALPGETAAGTARAMREARTAAAMNHHNAVSVFDVVEHEGVPWLVMEYFPSRALSEILSEDGPMPPERAGHIGAQIADALSEAHKLGIVHRDVKPGNILVDDRDYAKLSDFGIARQELDVTLTQTGMMTGTPAYLAPELVTGDSPSPASDVWALGATIYAAVEGEPPHGTQGTPIQVLYRITHQPVPRPDNAGPLLPVLHGMLAKDPRDRPTMAEVATDLKNPPAATLVVPTPPSAASTLPPPQLPPPTAGATNDGGGRRRVLPVLLAAGLVAAFATGGWLLSRVGQDDPATTSAGPTQTDDSQPAQATQDPDEKEPKDKEPKDKGPKDKEPKEKKAKPPAGDPAAFVEQYYALMPNDTDAGWSMLGGALKGQGKSSYESFWAGIDRVEVRNVRAETPTSVVYDITYVGANGTSNETKRITLEPRGHSYAIVADEGA